MHDLWHCFIESAKDATELLGASLATGHFWLPQTQAEYSFIAATTHKGFKALFSKVEASELNEYLTGTKESPWDFDLSEAGLKSKSAALANLFINQLAILVSILIMLLTPGRCLIFAYCIDRGP